MFRGILETKTITVFDVAHVHDHTTVSGICSSPRSAACLTEGINCRVVIAAVILSREVHSTMSDQGSRFAERHTVQFVTCFVDGLHSQSATYGGQD